MIRKAIYAVEVAGFLVLVGAVFVVNAWRD